MTKKTLRLRRLSRRLRQARASKQNRRPCGRRIEDQDDALANAVGRLLFRTMDTLIPGAGLADAFEQSIKAQEPAAPPTTEPEVITLRRNKDGVYE